METTRALGVVGLVLSVAAGLDSALWWVTVVVSLMLAMTPSSARRAWIVVRTLPRDVPFLWRLLRCARAFKKMKRLDLCIPDAFDDNVRLHPHKVLLKFEGQAWTFQQMADYSRRVADVFEARGFVRGEVVALLMGNCPEYVGAWLGLSRLGVVAALINHNQRGAALAHSLRVARCRAVLFEPALREAMLDAELEDELVDGLELLELRVGPHDDSSLSSSSSSTTTTPSSARASAVEDLTLTVREAPTTDPKSQRPGLNDPLLYIYTSGTTGLPKASKILHSRYFAFCSAFCSAFAIMSGMRRDDVVYCALPLYHATGVVAAVGYGLVGGMTVVLKPKFSASAFIPDCIRHQCTVVQYVGELCRYVLAVPQRPCDTHHTIRLMVGNGMRPQVWQRFVDRFHVRDVMELYGATEGNATLMNVDNTIGAVGFLPRLLPLAMFPLAFVRVDQATGEVDRDARDGRCIRCDVGEPGMLIGYISDGNPTRQFHGYLDDDASDKKILRDVFARGDKWFMTGDILVMNELGYVYFRDRLGDTFRWKGENVSTAEVEAVVSAAFGERDVAVYGVEVAGAEGRAGMLAIGDPDGSLDGLALTRLARAFDRHLPTYARPLFVRVRNRLDTTGTFKIVKVTLQDEGYDPSVVADPLFLRVGPSFVPLTEDLLQDVRSGKMRL